MDDSRDAAPISRPTGGPSSAHIGDLNEQVRAGESNASGRGWGDVVDHPTDGPFFDGKSARNSDFNRKSPN